MHHTCPSIHGALTRFRAYSGNRRIVAIIMLVVLIIGSQILEALHCQPQFLCVMAPYTPDIHPKSRSSAYIEDLWSQLQALKASITF